MMFLGWVAIVFLILILAVSSLLPRTPEDMAAFANTHGNTVMDFFVKTGFFEKDTLLFNPAETLWFKAIVLSILIFMLIAALKLSKKAFFWYKNSKPEVDEPKLFKSFYYRGTIGEVSTLLIFYLQKLGYKAEVIDEGLIVAKKGIKFYGCLVMIHLSLVMLVVSGIYSMTTYNEQTVYLPEGKTIAANSSQDFSKPGGLALKAESMWAEYYGIDDGDLNGQIKDYFAKVKFYEGDTEESKVISTSKPVTIKGQRYFLTKYGATGVILVRNEGGAEELEVFPVKLQEGFLQGSYLSKNNVAIAVTFGGQAGSGQQEKLAYYIYEYNDSQWERTEEGESNLNAPIAYKGMEYIFQDVNRVGEIKILKQVNSTPFYLGMLFLVLGLVGSLYFKNHTLEIRMNPEGGLEIRGWFLLPEGSLMKELEQLKNFMALEVSQTGDFGYV